jgi:hypothetical protein
MARLTTAPGWGNVSENRWGKVSEKLSRYWGNDLEKRQLEGTFWLPRGLRSRMVVSASGSSP